MGCSQGLREFIKSSVFLFFKYGMPYSQNQIRKIAQLVTRDKITQISIVRIKKNTCDREHDYIVCFS